MKLVVKNLPPSTGGIRDLGSIPGLERFPGGGMATHSSILTWRIAWTEEPGGLRSIGSRVRHDWSDLAHMHTTDSIGLIRLKIFTPRPFRNDFADHCYRLHEMKGWNKWSLMLFLKGHVDCHFLLQFKLPSHHYFHWRLSYIFGHCKKQ